MGFAQIGYRNGWDQNVGETQIVLGMIDIVSEASSDDGSTTISHKELMLRTVQHLSCRCIVRVIELQANADQKEFMDALNQLIDEKIRVISVSLGVQEMELDESFQDKILSNEVMLICASGNDHGEQLMYPAAWDCSISVMACNINGRIYRANKQYAKKSFVAPGLHVKIGEKYYSGTSIATVYVAVECAVYAALHPEASRIEILNAMIQACDETTDYVYGIIQINRLVEIE